MPKYKITKKPFVQAKKNKNKYLQFNRFKVEEKKI